MSVAVDNVSASSHTGAGLRAGALVMALLALAGCATSAGRSAEVTRFHLNEPIPRQAVVIQPAAGMDEASIEYGSYRQIVAEALSKTGFTVTDDEAAPLRADLAVTRGLQQVAAKSSGVRIGVGMGSYGRSGGISGGVSAPVGGRSGGERYVTRLKVELIDNERKAVLWEGEAVDTAAAAPVSPVGTVRALAAALFSDFPGESGKTVSVPVPAPAD